MKKIMHRDNGKNKGIMGNYIQPYGIDKNKENQREREREREREGGRNRQPLTTKRNEEAI